MIIWISGLARADITLDVMSIPADLNVPPITADQPAPGKRVAQQLPANAGTAVIHSLYLPDEWPRGRSFPVLVEYLGLRKS